MKSLKNKFEWTPIGYLFSEQKEPYQAARQPDKESKPAIIQLNSGCQFEQAIQDLNGCSHLWILYFFHKNPNWKPMVQAPRAHKKIGVFATRAPYRPNPIGMSVVRLEKIEGLQIFIGPNDILNETPILDIKPYHSESDLILDSKIEWLQTQGLPKHTIHISPLAESQFEFLKENGFDEVQIFTVRQLEYDPTNSDKKRVQEKNGYWTISYRAWRIDFILTEKTVSILSIHSGYNESDFIELSLHFKNQSHFLAPLVNKPSNDTEIILQEKIFHKKFKIHFDV